MKNVTIKILAASSMDHGYVQGFSTAEYSQIFLKLRVEEIGPFIEIMDRNFNYYFITIENLLKVPGTNVK